MSENKPFLYSLVTTTWVIGFLGYSVQIQFDYTSNIGWDCELGVCGHVPWKLSSKFYLVSILFLASIIAVSYIIMWKKVRTSGRVLTRSGSTTLDLEERQKRLTRMILILLFSYLLCNVPMHLNYVFTLPRNFYYVSILFYSAQYAINIIIYHLISLQYRKASHYFLMYFLSKTFCRFSSNERNFGFSMSKKTTRSRTNTISAASKKY